MARIFKQADGKIAVWGDMLDDVMPDADWQELARYVEADHQALHDQMSAQSTRLVWHDTRRELILNDAVILNTEWIESEARVHNGRKHLEQLDARIRRMSHDLQQQHLSTTRPVDAIYDRLKSHESASSLWSQVLQVEAEEMQALFGWPDILNDTTPSGKRHYIYLVQYLVNSFK